MKQVSLSPDGQAIQGPLVEIYKKKQETGFASAKLTFEEAEILLEDLAKPYAETVLILDALDECQEGSRSQLVEALNRLLTKKPAHLKILISSRRDQDIKRQLENTANVAIEATDNHDDISKFVKEKIDEDRERRRQYRLKPISDDLQEHIVGTLLRKSNGM